MFTDSQAKDGDGRQAFLSRPGRVEMMFEFWRRHKIYPGRVRREVEALIDEHGDAAYEFARSRRIATLQQRNLVEHRFWCVVARAIAHRTGRKIGVDTATRYISSSYGRGRNQ